MDVLRNCIDRLYRNVRIKDLIPIDDKSSNSIFIKDQLFSGYWENRFLEGSADYSSDETKAMWDYLCNTCLGDKELSQVSFGINILGHVSDIVLKEHQYEPLCKFENLLRWQDISLYMGEDIFTTGFMARKDAISTRGRDYFTWSAILRTDNFRLRQLLDKGVAENHFHLKGSANHVFLNWISAMNDPHRARMKIERFIRKEQPEFRLRKQLRDLRTNIYIAAKIRHLIYVNAQHDWAKDIKNIKFADLLYDSLNVNDLSRDIGVSAALFAYTYNDKRGDKRYLDYAIEKNIPQTDRNEFLVYRGERKLLYEWQKRIYSSITPNHERQYLADLLYLYQVIYVQFRSQFIQNDGAVGFASFASFDQRKELFIEDTHYVAVRDFLAIAGNRLHQNIKQFETRITPKDTSRRMKDAINSFAAHSKLRYYEYDPISRYLKRLEPVPRHHQHSLLTDLADYFHAVHFIKEHDQVSNKLSACINPRHNKLRNKIKKEVDAITELRESYADAKTHILGIDAANTEFGARPEVFAQCYRFLSKHLPKRSPLDLGGDAPQLRRTFHAGEDFFDIVDGLRTIDEAIEFCGLTRGDRIGHALAMGIDAEAYYTNRIKELYLPKQLLLDNIVWMLMLCKRYSIEISHQLEKQYYDIYQDLFRSVYAEMPVPEMLVYYKAYQLRGDDPCMYLKDEYKSTRNNALTFWQRCALDDRTELRNIRADDEAVKLLREYHFCQDVKCKGEVVEKFEVTLEHRNVVAKLQRNMQDKVNSLGIGIEANPTSNRLISKFGMYCEHPIIKWYNLGLTYDNEALNACPQMFVSINTDDQGIFNTCLENEYALLVLALQKDKNQDGSRKYSDAYIYDWVDRIRNNGIEQSFLQLNERAK